MLPPMIIPVVSGTKIIHLTALSLFNQTSSVFISWSDGSAIFGAEFVGPNPQCILGDKVFGLPIVTIDSIPTEIHVSFDFNDDLMHQHSVSKPITKRVGPEGSATQVQISGYACSDDQHKTPTTLTILFERSLHGFTVQK